MTDTSPLQHIAPATPSAARAGSATASTVTDSVAFRALLERLEKEARALDDQVQRVDDPEGLAQAVDRAHASLQDALSLGDRLLEAFRQAALQPSTAKRGASGG